MTDVLSESGLGAPPISWAATYCALLIAIALLLKANVIRIRRAKRIGIGDGGDRDLMLAMRAHGNFIESAPLAMVALVLLALLRAPIWSVHLIGVMMVASRILHALGISRSAGVSFGRTYGMILGLTALGLSPFLLIWFAWR